MPGQDTIEAPHTVEDRVPYYEALFDARGIENAIRYFLTTIRAFANSARNTLQRGEEAFGSSNAIANLKMTTDFAAMDRAIRNLWPETELFADRYSPLWTQIGNYATNFNASISRMNNWAARRDVVWAETQEIADAVQEGNLDADVITPQLKNDYIRQAYQQGTAFYESDAAANIRANYTPEDIAPTVGANMPLYVGLAVGAVVLFFAFRK